MLGHLYVLVAAMHIMIWSIVWAVLGVIVLLILLGVLFSLI